MSAATGQSVVGQEIKIGKHDVRVKHLLGEGGFAFIYVVEPVGGGREMVLKRMILQTDEARSVARKEMTLMQQLEHPNIVQVIDAEITGGMRTCHILMELCPGGHLLELLQRRGGRMLTQQEVLKILTDVVSAVRFLHGREFAHRDLKLENVLLAADGSYKLCDFGSAYRGPQPLDTSEQRANAEELLEKTTTQMYRAPEMVDLYMSRALDVQVDVWALGCIAYAMAYLKHPFQDAGNLGILNARIKFPQPCPFSEDFNELVRRMLTADLARRATIEEVWQAVMALRQGLPLPPPGEREGAGGGEGPKAMERRPSASRPGLKTKVAPPPPTQAGLNPNSVAARRLASRLGGSSHSLQVTPQGSAANSPVPASPAAGAGSMDGGWPAFAAFDAAPAAALGGWSDVSATGGGGAGEASFSQQAELLFDTSGPSSAPAVFDAFSTGTSPADWQAPASPTRQEESSKSLLDFNTMFADEHMGGATANLTASGPGNFLSKTTMANPAGLGEAFGSMTLQPQSRLQSQQFQANLAPHQRSLSATFSTGSAPGMQHPSAAPRGMAPTMRPQSLPRASAAATAHGNARPGLQYALSAGVLQQPRGGPVLGSGLIPAGMAMSNPMAISALPPPPALLGTASMPGGAFGGMPGGAGRFAAGPGVPYFVPQASADPFSQLLPTLQGGPRGVQGVGVNAGQRQMYSNGYR